MKLLRVKTVYENGKLFQDVVVPITKPLWVRKFDGGAQLMLDKEPMVALDDENLDTIMDTLANAWDQHDVVLIQNTIKEGM